MEYINSLEFAQELDRQDPLAGFRGAVSSPQVQWQTGAVFCR